MGAWDMEKLDKEIRDSVKGKSPEELLRLKYDKTMPSTEKLQEIRSDVSTFLKMLQMPIAPSGVIKLQKKITE